MSLYGDYVKEKRGFDIIEKEHGFATYQIDGETLYIADIYVSLEMRRTGLAREMCEEIRVIAKSHGCKRIMGSADPRAKNCTDGVRLMLAMKLEIASIENGLIFFILEPL